MQNPTLCRYCTLKEMEHNSPLLKHGLCIVTSFQRVLYGKKGKKSDFTTLNQAVRVNIRSYVLLILCSLDMM